MITLNFGKHKGKRLDDCPTAYILWLSNRELQGGYPIENAMETEIYDAIWSQRETILASCFCGKNVPIGNHDSMCYGSVLGSTFQETLNKMTSLIESQEDKFRLATRLQPLHWVIKNRPNVVKAARDYLDQGLCWHCQGKLVPIGNSRANGKEHDDWPSRRLHKQCWKQLQG